LRLIVPVIIAFDRDGEGRGGPGRQRPACQQIVRPCRLCLNGDGCRAARRQQYRRGVIIAWPDRTQFLRAGPATRIREDRGTRIDQQRLVRRHPWYRDKLHQPCKPLRHFPGATCGERTGSLQRGHDLYRQGLAEDA
jgi:hypothetical protein